MIPECSYRRPYSPDRFWCDSPKVVCGTSFPASMCQHCTLAEVSPRLDFFSATNKLKSSPFRATEVSPSPAPAPQQTGGEAQDCKPCNKKRKARRRGRTAKIFQPKKRVVHRRSDLDGKTVVWVYWAAGARTDEMMWSMASVQQNLSGASNLVICGDKPDWWKGEFIPSPRVKRDDVVKTFGSARFMKWCDSIVKLWAIIESPLVTEDFLWMYDDTFILKPYSFDEIARPVAQGFLGDGEQPKSHSWREVRRRTGRALSSRGLPTWNYSTHYPAVYSKTKLVETIQEFGLPQNPRLIESLYLNHHNKSHPGRALNVFQYQKRVKPGGGWQPRNVPVLNVGQFNGTVRQSLIDRIPGIEDRVRELRDG